MAIGDVGRVKFGLVRAINRATTTGLSLFDYFTFFWAVDIVSINQRSDICVSIT